MHKRPWLTFISACLTLKYACFLANKSRFDIQQYKQKEKRKFSRITNYIDSISSMPLTTNQVPNLKHYMPTSLQQLIRQRTGIRPIYPSKALALAETVQSFETYFALCLCRYIFLKS